MLTRPWPPLGLTNEQPLITNPYAISANDSYIPLPPPIGTDRRITEDGNLRITEDNNVRILESGASPFTFFRLTEDGNTRITENGNNRILE